MLHTAVQGDRSHQCIQVVKKFYREGKKKERFQHQKSEAVFAICHPLIGFILLQIESSWTFHGNESLVLVRLILKPHGSWCYRLIRNNFLLKEQNSEFFSFAFCLFPLSLDKTNRCWERFVLRTSESKSLCISVYLYICQISKLPW